MRVLETNPEFKYLEESIETINTQLVALVSPEVRFVATIYRSMVAFTRQEAARKRLLRIVDELSVSVDERVQNVT